MNTKRNLDDLAGELDDIYALIEVSDLALRKIEGCQTVSVEATLRMAHSHLDSIITELRGMAKGAAK